MRSGGYYDDATGINRNTKTWCYTGAKLGPLVRLE